MRRENGEPTRRRAQRGSPETGAYQPPSYEVICLACEISAYAPDGDTPLF